MGTLPAVVIDVGTDTCRAGLSGEEDPSVTFRTFTGRHPDSNDNFSHFKPTTICKRSDEIFAGDDITGTCGHLTRTYPVSRGSVEDWLHMKKILCHIYNRLNLKSENQPVILTEPPYNPKANRETAAEVMFEEFHVPAFHITIDTPLALPGVGRTSGVAVCCGEGVTSVVSVYDGYTFPMSAMRQNLAGRDVTEYLGQLMAEQGNNILPWSSGLEIVRKIKDTTAFASLNTLNNSVDCIEPITYTLPDGNTLSIGEERYQCTEVLFQPSVLGKEYSPLHTLLNDSIHQADIDCRRELYRNIVITGGTSKLLGLSDRLLVELEGIVPDKLKVIVTVPSKCQTAVWCGAANLVSLSTFDSQWISKAEYQEHGVNIVHKKCWSFT